jgi:hypothetical protein
MPRPSNIVSSVEVEGDKGQRVRFIRGTHVKKKGWLQLSKGLRGENQIYVLVDLGKDRVKKTYIALSNVNKFVIQTDLMFGVLDVDTPASQEAWDQVYSRMFELFVSSRTKSLQGIWGLSGAIFRQCQPGSNRRGTHAS